MLNYILRKLIYSFFVLFGIITVVFILFNVLPGDPARLMLGQRADVSSIEAINKDLGRDKPLWKQYLIYLNDLSPLSFHEKNNPESALFIKQDKYGAFISLVSISSKTIVLKEPYLRRSYQTGRRATEIIADALPGTAVLAISAMVIATILGILLGIISAINKGGIADKTALVLSVFGMSLPSFVAAILMMWVFGYLLGKYTGLPITGSLYEIDEFTGEHLVLKNLILPAVTLGVRPLAIIVQLTRSSMLDVLSMDYVRTATAKGLSRYAVMFRHALPNAMNPVVTAVSGWLASLMAGAVFIEIIFGWKGIGMVMLDALNKYDLPVVMGAVLVVSLIFVIINVFVDILYGIIDPRVRVS